jgi:hypothetical protein
LCFLISVLHDWVLHGLTRVRIPILAKIFCFSLLPFCFDSTFIHSFIVLGLFNSSYLSVAFSDTDLNTDLSKILLCVLFSVFRFAFPAILWLNTCWNSLLDFWTNLIARNVYPCWNSWPSLLWGHSSSKWNRNCRQIVYIVRFCQQESLQLRTVVVRYVCGHASFLWAR